MPLKQHPTDPDKVIYASRHYDIPQLQGVTTTQRPWVGLTDEEVCEICDSYYNRDSELAQMVEAKLKEKNT
jgi:hypothetical protein